MRLSGTIARDDLDPGETMAIIAGHMGIALETNTTAKMAIIAGHMGIALETNTTAKHAKTKPQATRTEPPATTPWAVAKPINLNTYDIQGGVFFHLRIT